MATPAGAASSPFRPPSGTGTGTMMMRVTSTSTTTTPTTTAPQTTTAMDINHLDSLPPELLLRVCTWLSPSKDLFRTLPRVCKRFYETIKLISLYIQCDVNIQMGEYGQSSSFSFDKRIFWLDDVDTSSFTILKSEHWKPKRRKIDATGKICGVDLNVDDDVEDDGPVGGLLCVAKTKLNVAVNAVLTQDPKELVDLLRKVLVMTVFDWVKPKHVNVLFSNCETSLEFFDNEIPYYAEFVNVLAPRELVFSWHPKLLEHLRGEELRVLIEQSCSEHDPHRRLTDFQPLVPYKDRLVQLGLGYMADQFNMDGLDELTQLESLSIRKQSTGISFSVLNRCDFSRLTNLTTLDFERGMTFEEFLLINAQLPSLREFIRFSLEDPTNDIRIADQNNKIPSTAPLSRYKIIGVYLHQMDSMDFHSLADTIAFWFPNVHTLKIDFTFRDDASHFVRLPDNHLLKILRRFESVAMSLGEIVFVLVDGDAGVGVGRGVEVDDDEDDLEEDFKSYYKLTLDQFERAGSRLKISFSE
ncbi:hypothetical protein HDU76_000808 [Blyttiomyces sp. JEL0837]|nr:hypothetical protein HDU76_000808 [Blyttiomyces sp. JEL0837]